MKKLLIPTLLLSLVATDSFGSSTSGLFVTQGQAKKQQKKIVRDVMATSGNIQQLGNTVSQIGDEVDANTANIAALNQNQEADAAAIQNLQQQVTALQQQLAAMQVAPAPTAAPTTTATTRKAPTATPKRGGAWK